MLLKYIPSPHTHIFLCLPFKVSHGLISVCLTTLCHCKYLTMARIPAQFASRTCCFDPTCTHHPRSIPTTPACNLEPISGR
eukprot:c39917_g1_i1 orf=78-320(+)